MAGKVFVGCKLPHGLLLNQPRGTNGQPVEGDPVELKGANSATVIGGYGITEVDADFFAAWMKENAKFPAVANNLIFAEPKKDAAVDRAQEQAKAETGVEGINPDKPDPTGTIVPEPQAAADRAKGKA